MGIDVRCMRLATSGPFHLEASVRILQRRPANPVDVWEFNRYSRVLDTPEGLVLIEVSNRGTVVHPDVRLCVRSGNPSAATRLALVQTARRVLGLDVDPAPLERLTKSAPRLRATACALRGMRPPRFAGLYETFANVVPFQQLSLDAGVAIVGRLVERFGTQLEHDGRVFASFPTSRAVADARVRALRECGLSNTKAQTLHYLARSVESGELTEAAIAAMPTHTALKALIQLPGIGPWSAGVVLLRGFGRIDVFPPGDVGAVHALTQHLHLGTPEKLADVVERFGDHRGYLYFFGLGESLLRKGLIHSARS
jgi:DNA-3-methyladenine glycosylase II